MTPDELAERLVGFAVRIGKVVDALPDSRLGCHIAGQLVRSGTSPAPNYGEARAAESHADFMHKLGVVLKELNESLIWLRIIQKSELIKVELLKDIVEENTQLSRIIGSSIKTARSTPAN